MLAKLQGGVNDHLKTDDNDKKVSLTATKPNKAGYYWLTLHAKEESSSGSLPFAGSFCLPFNVENQ